MPIAEWVKYEFRSIKFIILIIDHLKTNYYATCKRP